MGCVYVCTCIYAQSCLTLCDPMDGSPPGSSVHGISQARILEWVAIPFPGDLPHPGIKTISQFSCIGRQFFTTEPPGKPIEDGKSEQQHKRSKCLIIKEHNTPSQGCPGDGRRSHDLGKYNRVWVLSGFNICRMETEFCQYLGTPRDYLILIKLGRDCRNQSNDDLTYTEKLSN